MSDLYQKYLDDPMSIIFTVTPIPFGLHNCAFGVCSIPNGYSFGNCRRKLECCRYWRAFEEFGAIFIPRSFNNEAYTERNLNNVIEFILVNKIPLKCLLKAQDHEMGNCYYLNMVF